MGTRCVIKVEGFDKAKVYKHWDGYPSATLPWLEEFNKDFEKHRSNDYSYKFAQLLRSSAFDADDFDLDDSRYTGWGVLGYHEKCGDCEYVYLLRKDGSVTYEELH